MPYKKASEFQALAEEFYDIQLLGDDAIPAHMETFKTKRGDLRMDVLWSYVGDIKDTAEGVLCYPRLRKVVHLIVMIPHSNAEEERVFSIIQKNKTCFCPNLDPEETLASVVTVKLAMESQNVESFKIPDEVLTASKSATYKYKLQHSSK